MQPNPPVHLLRDPLVERLLRLALEEDIGQGDATSEALLPEGRTGRLAVVARQPLVVAGLPLAERVFHLRHAGVGCMALRRDGDYVPAGTCLMQVEGDARALLEAERTALNLLQRMSGVATLTRRYVQAIRHTGAVLLDTRKTIPGLRLPDKYATACGGAQNHRLRLDDRIMIKDNHIALHGGIAGAVEAARRAFPALEVEVECDTLAQYAEALETAPDYILLDNMPLENLRQAVGSRRGRVKLEASGGVTLSTIRAIAETGVDFISVGALTHSAVAVDIGLDSL